MKDCIHSRHYGGHEKWRCFDPSRVGIEDEGMPHTDSDTESGRNPRDLRADEANNLFHQVFSNATKVEKPDT